jgi:hypothetical protein
VKTRKRTRLIVLCTAAGAALVVASSALAWTVTMTAQTSLKRTYSWDIEKSVSQEAVTLKAGETANVTYAVTVTPTGPVDSDWAVSGKVTMSEEVFPQPDPAPVVNTVSVTILPDELAAPVACVPSPFPVDLDTNSLVCDYWAPLPDASGPRDAWMRATQVNGNARSVHTAFDFSNPTVSLVDESVTVTDTMGGTLGTVNAADGPKTFTYTKTVGPYTAAQCGQHTVDNTASFLTNDSGATGSADADVDVTVVCLPPPPGCTHTIGYWKTHAGFGPQADVVTPLLPIWLGTAAGAKSINVLTAAKAVSLLKMEGSNGVKAASNGINKLYAQLLGAKLSGADGADSSVIAGVIAAADAFLAGNDSSSWSGLTKAQQDTVNGWMSSLDDYNNGLVGVAHCG